MNFFNIPTRKQNNTNLNCVLGPIRIRNFTSRQDGIELFSPEKENTVTFLSLLVVRRLWFPGRLCCDSIVVPRSRLFFVEFYVCRFLNLDLRDNKNFHVMCFLWTLCRRQQIVDFRWLFFFLFTFRSTDFQKLKTSFVFRRFLLETLLRNDTFEARFVVGGRSYWSLFVAAFWSLLRKRFVGNCTMFPIAFIGTGFPSARQVLIVWQGPIFLLVVVAVAWRSTVCPFVHPLRWCCYVLRRWWIRVAWWYWWGALRSSCFRQEFYHCVGVRGAGFPSVLFPVIFLLVGLLCSSFRVSLTGSLDVSSRNIGCSGEFDFSVSKKRKQYSVLPADLYAS